MELIARGGGKASTGLATTSPAEEAEAERPPCPAKSSTKARAPWQRQAKGVRNWGQEWPTTREGEGSQEHRTEEAFQGGQPRNRARSMGKGISRLEQHYEAHVELKDSTRSWRHPRPSSLR